MRTFEQDTFASFAFFVQHLPDRCRKFQNGWRDFFELGDDVVTVNRVQTQTVAQRVVVYQCAVNAGFQRCIIGQIRNADRTAANFVFVTWTNTATGGADFGNRILRLTRTIQFTVERQDQRGVFRNHQGFGRDFDALFAHGRNFIGQVPRVQNNTVADHRQLTTPHNARRQNVQFVDLAVDHKGMASVVAPLETRDHICALGQPVYDFAFTFVAPLGADDNHVRHNIILIGQNPRPYSGA